MTAAETTRLDKSRPDTSRRTRLWVNWILALSTVLGAAAVQLFAVGAVMSTAACSNPNCPKPSGLVHGLLTYGAPAIAVAAILVSLLTAGHRRGWIVPASAWALLAADVLILIAIFS